MSLDLSDLFQVGVDILRTTVSAATKRILAQTGSITGGNGPPDRDNVEWWQHVGFASRPPKAQAGKKACQAIVVRQGGTDFAIASQDPRGLELYGALSDGETCVFAPGEDGTGQARILLKKDGSINLYTRKGNTSGGTGMLMQLDASGGAVRLLNDKGYGIIIDGDGVKITSGGAGLTLTGSGDASLIGKGKTQVDGASVCIGSQALPGVNAALHGPSGLAGIPSVKVLIE